QAVADAGDHPTVVEQAAGAVDVVTDLVGQYFAGEWPDPTPPDFLQPDHDGLVRQADHREALGQALLLRVLRRQAPSGVAQLGKLAPDGQGLRPPLGPRPAEVFQLLLRSDYGSGHACDSSRSKWSAGARGVARMWTWCESNPVTASVAASPAKLLTS